MNAWLGKVWQNLHGGQRGAIANWFVMAFAGIFISIVLTIAIPIMMTTQDRMDLGEALSVLKEYGYVAYGDPSGDWTTLGSLYTKNIYPQADSTYGIGSTTNRYLRGWYDNLVASNITGTVGNFTNVNSDTLAASGLTSGRIPIAGAGGLLGDDTDLTFTGGDTLTATKFATAQMTWSTLGAAHSWGGVVETGVLGENVAFGELCYFKSDGEWWRTDADVAATTDGILAICVVAGNDGDTGTFLTYGYVRDDSYAWGTVGGALYVDVTIGDMNQTAPSGSGDQVRRVGFAKSATIIFFAPDTVIIELT
jgi:hypothetical protein